MSFIFLPDCLSKLFKSRYRIIFLSDPVDCFVAYSKKVSPFKDLPDHIYLVVRSSTNVYRLLELKVTNTVNYYNETKFNSQYSVYQYLNSRVEEE